MFDGRFFDASHYQSQLDEELPHPLEHYLSVGFREGLNPTRFFDQRWYAWQNPDYTRHNENPYLHYLARGRFEGRDPSPRIDMKRYEAMTAQLSPEDRYPAILNGMRAPALGVYDTWEDMKDCRQAFLDAISVVAHRLPFAYAPRPYLVFLQCGPQSVHREWFRDAPRTWDLLVNYYDASGYDGSIGDYVFFQPGTKFTAVHKLLTQFPHILRQYRYVLFLDDDILVDADGLDRLFAIADAHRLDLAQMSLTPESHCIWPVFKNKSATGLRYVNGVEIMMPLLSARTIDMCGSCFGESVSGFGLDLMLGKRLSNAGHRNIAVVDEVTAVHAKPIDDAGGRYYEFLRSRLINPKAELWYLIERENLAMSFEELA